MLFHNQVSDRPPAMVLIRYEPRLLVKMPRVLAEELVVEGHIGVVQSRLATLLFDGCAFYVLATPVDAGDPHGVILCGGQKAVFKFAGFVLCLFEFVFPLVVRGLVALGCRFHRLYFILSYLELLIFFVELGH